MRAMTEGNAEERSDEVRSNLNEATAYGAKRRKSLAELILSEAPLDPREKTSGSNGAKRRISNMH